MKPNAQVLGRPKNSFGFSHNILRKNPNEFFGQLNTTWSPFQKAVTFPHLKEGQKVRLGQIGPLASKTKNLTPADTGTRRIRTIANGNAQNWTL